MMELTSTEPNEASDSKSTNENNTPPNNTTVLYACCTPGLTAFFDDKLSGRDDKQRRPAATGDGEPTDPPAKNGALARRELRYEANDSEIATAAKKPESSDQKPKATIFSVRKKFNRFFHLKNRGRKQIANIVTSTPINFLDSIGPDADYCITPGNVRKWKESMRHANDDRSLPLESFKYQCGHCKRVWYNNWELVDHMRETHVGYRFWFRRGYRCGICSSRFLINRLLIWHSRRYHNPV